jgi:hypothetical protein
MMRNPIMALPAQDAIFNSAAALLSARCFGDRHSHIKEPEPGKNSEKPPILAVGISSPGKVKLIKLEI